ncbi:MAG: hypothetical protein D6723_13170, partial [Acidobacteria bacterium]
MFEESLVVSGKQRPRGRMRWILLLTALVYLVAIAGTIVAGILLVKPEFGEAVLEVALVTPPPPPPPPPPPGPAPTPRGGIPPKAIVIPAGFVAPTVIPEKLPPSAEELPEVYVARG